MKRFSVLLAYPDWMCDGGAHDTFYHFTRANSVSEAVRKAQRAAVKHNALESSEAGNFVSLLVLSGHKEAVG